MFAYGDWAIVPRRPYYKRKQTHIYTTHTAAQRPLCNANKYKFSSIEKMFVLFELDRTAAARARPFHSASARYLNAMFILCFLWVSCACTKPPSRPGEYWVRVYSRIAPLAITYPIPIGPKQQQMNKQQSNEFPSTIHSHTHSVCCMSRVQNMGAERLRASATNFAKLV